MKTAHDPRHIKRIQLMQHLFTFNFNQKEKISDPKVKKIINKLPQLDQEISLAATEWPIDKINRIDLAILRLAIFELIIDKSTPYKVVIDEAVELAKKFGAESSPVFINGVLGKIISAHNLEKEEKNG